MIIEKHLLITDPDISIIQTLKSELDLSSNEIKLAINKGCLWLEKGNNINRIRRLKTVLQAGQRLHFYYNREILRQNPLEAELIEDNQAYSIWYKPAGMLSQGSRWGDHTTIHRYAEKNLTPQRNSIIVHRLDKMTSGLIILAHQRKVAASFTRLFENRQIEKHYRAIVQGNFKEAENEMTIEIPLNEKSAISHFQLIEFNQQYNQSILDVRIDTGRKHQIRQHLALTGYPVVGDRLYGEDPSGNKTDLQLTAYKLRFDCPVTGERKSYKLDGSKLPFPGA